MYHVTKPNQWVTIEEGKQSLFLFSQVANKKRLSIRTNLPAGVIMGLREAKKEIGWRVGDAIRNKDAKNAARQIRQAVLLETAYRDLLYEYTHSPQRLLYKGSEAIGILDLNTGKVVAFDD